MHEFYVNNKKDILRYHDLPGSGAPILFIHGLGCASTYDYPEVVSCMPLNGNRRILIDLLGYGYSDKPDDFSYSFQNHVEYLVDLVDSLHAEKVNIFGHSMGGSIAIALADRIKEKVSSLIITEGNLDPGGGLTSRRVASFSLDDYLSFGHDKIIDDSMNNQNEKWATTLKISNPRAVYFGAKDLVNGSTPTWRELLYSFPFPCTYIFGTKSLPDTDEQELSRNGINVFRVNDAGHNMATENPEGLSKIIWKGINLK